MQGVQILNEFMYEGAVTAPWFGIGFGCIFTGIIGACLFSTLNKIPKKIRDCAITILIGIALLGVGIGASAPRERIPRYQVIIDDEVRFNDFINKYKIVKQDGLIYTVEEREYNTDYPSKNVKK